jgi:hypothetical protein
MQEFVDYPLFWPVVIVGGIALVCFFAKFLFRIALALLAVMVVWYVLSYLGLVPSPENYFLEHPLDEEKARSFFSIDKPMKTDQK